MATDIYIPPSRKQYLEFFAQFRYRCQTHNPNTLTWLCDVDRNAEWRLAGDTELPEGLDVTITKIDKSPCRIHIHREVVCNNSEWFRRRLRTQSLQGCDSSVKQEITIQSWRTSLVDVSRLLIYIYTQNLPCSADHFMLCCIQNNPDPVKALQTGYFRDFIEKTSPRTFDSWPQNSNLPHCPTHEFWLNMYHLSQIFEIPLLAGYVLDKIRTELNNISTWLSYVNGIRDKETRRPIRSAGDSLTAELAGTAIANWDSYINNWRFREVLLCGDRTGETLFGHIERFIRQNQLVTDENWTQLVDERALRQSLQDPEWVALLNWQLRR